MDRGVLRLELRGSLQVFLRGGDLIELEVRFAKFVVSLRRLRSDLGGLQQEGYGLVRMPGLGEKASQVQVGLLGPAP